MYCFQCSLSDSQSQNNIQNGLDVNIKLFCTVFNSYLGSIPCKLLIVVVILLVITIYIYMYLQNPIVLRDT